MARFDGTFLEIGDFFNVSHTDDMKIGAKATWQSIQQCKKLLHVIERPELTSSICADKIHDFGLEEANRIRVTTAHVESPDPGDPRVLSKLHRLHCLVSIFPVKI
jgi:hypothetical protein